MADRPYLDPSNSNFHPSISQRDYQSFAAEPSVEDNDSSPSTPLSPPVISIRGNARDPQSISRLTSGERLVNGKVAIPRLDLPVASHNSRVSRACHNCRKQKNKCTGDRPSCLRCQEINVPCVYVDGKRERSAKHLTVVTSQLEHYESLVRDIYPKFDLEMAKIVDQALGKISSLSISSPTVASIPDDTPTPTTPIVSCLDHTLEDYNGDGSLQALGFVGEHSATKWLYRLKQWVGPTILNTSNQFDQPTGPSLSSCCFFLDDTAPLLANGPDLFAYPAQAVADELVDRYFQMVHPSFPIIGKEIFLGQCRSFYSSSMTQPGNKWMALLNMVFAIAAKHSEFSGDQHRLDHNNHTVYFSRAWQLSMNNNAILEHPNLQTTQIEGLISFYLLSTGQVNRSWRICGFAIQSAVTMGIHLRSEGTRITHVSKETRYRLWWGLYLLDTLLCVMTGRMPRMQPEHCATPLPVPYTEESFRDERVMMVIQDNQARVNLMNSLLSHNSSNEPTERSKHSTTHQPTSQQHSPSQHSQAHVSLYLLYSIDLAAVMREAMEILYSPGGARKSGNETEQAMKSLNNTADNWFSRLSATYRLTENETDRIVARQRTSLAFQYYSTKLVITQPALRAHVSGDNPLNAVYHQLATVCINAAAQMVDLLPDDPSITWFMEFSPWWCALHYLTQSIIVLITQLLFESKSRANPNSKPFERVQKALRWLTECSTRDLSFKRAWENFTNLLSSQGINAV